MENIQPYTDLVNAARQYIAAGLTIQPLRLDGEPSAFAPSNKSNAPVEKWFDTPCHIGLVCGTASGLECLRFHDDRLFSRWRLLVESILLRLPVFETPEGGCLVLYRCFEVSYSQPIAFDHGMQTPLLIESHGARDIITIIEHPLSADLGKLPLIQVDGPIEPPVIEPVQRRQLWMSAREFNKTNCRNVVLHSHSSTPTTAERIL